MREYMGSKGTNIRTSEFSHSLSTERNPTNL